MARFYGSIGFAVECETAPGVWRASIEEHTYIGNVTRNGIRWDQGDNMNEPIRVDNAISVIGDDYLNAHLADIRYVVYMGRKWKVASIQVQRPRIILQIAGDYHEQTSE